MQFVLDPTSETGISLLRPPVIVTGGQGSSGGGVAVRDATFTETGKVLQTEFNIRDEAFGARGARQVYDGVLSGTTVTSATAEFTPDDVGKIIFATNTTDEIMLQTTTVT